MFWIQYKDAHNDTIEIPLIPSPTEVDYPPSRDFEARKTQDEALVIQRPLVDSRPRKWIWRGYPPRIISYETQWQLLKTLDCKERHANGLSPIVGVWEDVVTDSGFGRKDGSSRLYTKVKFILVDRTPKPGGGLIAYDTSMVEFQISDPTFTSF